ncbi:MAG: PTS fructose transporter subunit IIB, partial [Erysipelotrichaceae bacterium]|nr:PTS fructose transporter subunit IIB [Erysipelotrichaceae bacterium]
MKTCTVVTVCGSGVVTSSMIALKIKEQLRERGWD